MEADEENLDTGGYDWPKRCIAPHLDASTQGIVWAFRHATQCLQNHVSCVFLTIALYTALLTSTRFIGSSNALF